MYERMYVWMDGFMDVFLAQLTSVDSLFGHGNNGLGLASDLLGGLMNS